MTTKSAGEDIVITDSLGKRRGLPLAIAGILLLTLCVLLVTTAPASALATYDRTALYTFSNAYSLPVAVDAAGNLMVGPRDSSGNDALWRIAAGTPSTIYAYGGAWPQVYDIKIIDFGEHAGDYLVSEFGSPNGTLTRITPDGARTPIFAPSFGTPQAADVDVDGGYVVFFSDFTTTQSLFKLDHTGVVQHEYPLPIASRGSGCVAVDHSDGTYVIAQAANSYGGYPALLKYDPDGVSPTTPMTIYSYGWVPAGGQPALFGVAIDSEGNYIVTEPRYEALVKIKPVGDHYEREVIFQFDPGTLPYGVAIDSAGDYVVAEAGTRTISRISPEQEDDTTPPVVTVPADITAEATGPSGAEVIFTATAMDLVDGSLPVTCSLPSGSMFPLGTTTVYCSATDAAGNTGYASFSVTVQDTAAPLISVSVTPWVLWSPNHKMVAITATVTATDICDANLTVVLTSITSSEPDDAKGNGDGNTVDDIQGAAFGTADYEFLLRAERAGAGDGRVYTITYTATDASGNSTSGVATVIVPHSR